MENDAPSRKEFEQLQASVNQNLALTLENKQLLLNMRKWGRVAFWFKVFIWTVVLIAPVLLYPYIAEYFPQLPDVPGFSETSSSTNSSLFGLPSPSAVQQFLHSGK